MATATVTSKCQITIPAEVRKDLNLKPGDRVEVQVSRADAPGRIVKNGSVRRLQGIFGKFDRVVTIEEMNETIEKGWAGLLEPEDEPESN